MGQDAQRIKANSNIFGGNWECKSSLHSTNSVIFYAQSWALTPKISAKILGIPKWNFGWNEITETAYCTPTPGLINEYKGERGKAVLVGLSTR